MGWCAVEPRTAYTGLVRVFTVPWKDRHEDRADDTVWAVTCLFVRASSRRRGVSRARATAAIEEELHVGTVRTFEAAGMQLVACPTPRRAVLRVDF